MERDWPGNSSSASRTWASGAKLFGEGSLVVPASALAWWGGAGGRAPRLARAGRQALEAWGLSQVATQALKYGTARERPDGGQVSHTAFFASLDGRAGLSFPSGHASTAASTLSAFALEYGSDHPWLAVACHAVSLSTAASRVHDGRHWLTDAVAGWAIGYASARAVRAFEDARGWDVTALPLPSGAAVAFRANF